MRPLVITTPIYYVNDVPHIGHAYTTIAADVIARHYRNLGRRVYFLTGTDEHGLKVQQAASERGVAPKAHCDEMVGRFTGLWEKLNITNDGFIRTTDLDHVRFVQKALDQLKSDGEIESRDYSGFYCTPCERFWTDKDLVDASCPDCRRPVERLKEKNYFFRMGRQRDAIRDAIRSDRLEILPGSRKNEVLGFLEQPLTDLCISRPVKRLSWGIPLPFDSEYVTYVWFDALLNYTSALEYSPGGTSRGKPPAWDKAEVVHLIGKDILMTHAIYWPSMLLGLRWAMPARIVAHGWWTVEGSKMSKSLKNVVDPNQVIEEFGADAFRYFLLREVPFGQDGDYSRAAVVQRINHDLADEFGNLVSRLSALARQKDKGLIHLDAFQPDSPDGPRNRALGECRAATETFQFSVALGALSNLFSFLNKKINDERPWESGEAERRKTISTCAVELARGMFLLSSYTPDLVREAARQMGCGGAMADSTKLFSNETVLKSKAWTIEPGKPIILKVEDRMPLTQTEKLPKETAGAGGIDISDFQKIELRTARILEAARVEKSDKLIRLRVTTGSEERQVVAGIGRQYAPEDLVGRTVTIVANLKPRKIFGVESRGMILAAGTETTLRLLIPDGETDPGTPIK